MSDYPREEASSSPNLPFFLDRWIAYALLAYTAGGFALTSATVWHGYVKDQDMGAVGLLAYLAKRWSVHLRYLLTVPAIAWACLGLCKSRRWTIVLLAYWLASSLIYDIRYAYLYGIVGNALFLAYVLARFFGWLGPRTADRFGLAEG